ncbi:MAG: adenylyltransferase/cytidyltransferase family protein, partial [Lentisphaeria bacterium]|nr:adenylyltransferase/cytidyltransferase family protein [Lentisphaeria bacterium]
MSSEKKKNLPCRNPLEKIFSEAEKLVSWRESLKKKGLKLVLTNGCFDILHRGHTQYLYGARSAGDALLVLLNSDSSVKRSVGSKSSTSASACNCSIEGIYSCDSNLLNME